MKILKLISENLISSKTKISLDLGCGPDGFLDVCKNLFKKLCGYDLNKKMREWKISKINSILNNLYEVNNINVLSLFHVLEHIKNPLEFVEEIKEKFLNLETIIIEVPNKDELLISEFDSKAYKNNHYSLEHIDYFNSSTLTGLL